jgi:hypothetical protein
VRRSEAAEKAGKKTGEKTANGMKAAVLATAVLAAAGILFYFGSAVPAAKASGPASANHRSAARTSAEQLFAPHQSIPSHSMTLPLLFEPNQGQVAAPVKFLAHGAGYGLFLTADEAVLDLRRAVKGQPSSGGVVRMRLDGANSSAAVSGVSPLPGKDSYFIGNDPSKWRRDIPQFARVQYQAVYPGVDLVYYGNQGQLEYDFRVAPSADPNQIAFSFQGATVRIVPGDSGDSGDLVLSTADGDVRFHAPRVYQPAAPQSAAGNASGNAPKTVAGAFRQIAANKIGFSIGDYDHSRELVIDPTLTYSTYLGGTGTEALVQIAVDSSLNIYLGGSTNALNFPLPAGFPPANPPLPGPLGGAQNLFIAKIQPANAGTGTPELVYFTYLGGSGTDSMAGIAVDANNNIYVAGSTSSANFPTTLNAFQQTPPQAGTHGFLSLIAATQSTTPPSIVYNLAYSTYLAGTNAAGNATDEITGLAIDTSNQYAYVTGNTTSSNVASDSNPFPANPNNAYQLQSNSPGDAQFFATKINTTGSGLPSLIYSTYFGGGNPVGATAQGGGIAVDASGDMYITGTTNMLSSTGPNGALGFPLLDAYQSCLNQPQVTSCAATTNTDAFVAKIDPAESGLSSLVYSTYVGGSNNDTGLAIAVDSMSNAYITGSTSSTDWICACASFQDTYGGDGDAFIAKIGNLTGSVYPLSYFTYIGGPGADVGNAILVDSVQAIHVAGNTSGGLPTVDAIQPGSASSYNGTVYGGNGDAFVALISTSESGTGVGDYLTYLGGGQQDQGTGIALDIYGAAYVAGNTQSSQSSTPPVPITATAYQSQLPGPQAAFVSRLGAVSTLVVTYPTTSPSPNPVAAGTQVAFTFDITNSNANGPSDPVSDMVFTATVPATGNASSPTAKVTSGSGTCGTVEGSTISCFVQTLAVGAMATVEVDVTPIINPTPPTQEPTQVTVSGSASANGGPFVSAVSQQANVVDFSIQAQPGYQTVAAGQPATFSIQFCPTLTQRGYSGTITPSQTTLPSIVTSPSPSFLPTSVILSGSACGFTTLTIPTVARPVTTGSLLRRGSFYAAWLPIGGLSLIGMAIGSGRRRRRWLAGAILGLTVGIILLLPGCGSSSSATASQGGTAAGVYTITIEGSAGTGASHSQTVQLQVT